MINLIPNPSINDINAQAKHYLILNASGCDIFTGYQVLPVGTSLNDINAKCIKLLLSNSDGNTLEMQT